MDAFLGEIRIFAGYSAIANPPAGWAYCKGQTLPIAGNEALFALLGTIYGGDGRTNFGLPNLGGRVALGSGHGPGLSSYAPGDKGGLESVTLTLAQIPSHTHAICASTQTATTSTPGTNVTFAAVNPPATLYNDLSKLSGADADFSASAIGPAGGFTAHDNYMPTVALNYIICTSGIYPDFQ